MNALPSEIERLSALHSLNLLDTPPTESFDRITRLASSIFEVPVALVSLVDTERQWFLSRVGMALPETCREDAFCDYTVRSPEVMVVNDATLDPRFAQNPLVTGETGIRFYAGAPLRLRTGHQVGSLCLIDRKPRVFTDLQKRQLQDLAEMVVAQIELQRSVGRIDDVTHLPNQAQLAVDLDALCASQPGAPCMLVMLELMGHTPLLSVMRAVGMGPLEDMVRSAGRRLRRFALGTSPVYHVGITRLAVLLSDVEEARQEVFLEDLLREIREPFAVPDHFLIEQQPRLGAASFHLTPDEAADALRRATAALYHRESKRGRVARFDAEADRHYRRSYQLLGAVPHAMAHGEFSLVYQPQLDRGSLGFRCAEALLRWNHPTLGAIAPGEFIPLVENTSLIHLVTEWVLHTALAQLKQWEREGLFVNVAVNISARNLEDDQFIRILANALALHQVQPARLQLECTENVALTDELTLKTINVARSMGIQIALDDFGSGYCNFGSLYSLPAEVLKLDQSLIRPIGTDKRALDIVRSMIRLGHSLGYRMLAEGVETATIFDLLIEIGCDEIQGYYISRPLPPDAAFEKMKAQNDVFLSLR